MLAAPDEDPGTHAAARRIAVIGLDAVAWPFVEDHLEALPHLRRAAESGVLHRLDQRTNTLNGAMWPTLYTGEHPGVHGFYHDLGWDPAAMRLRRVSEDWLSYRPFWHRLDAAGLEVIAVDAPHTFRPRPRSGTEIVNWNSHDHMSPFTVHPPALRDEIVRRFGGRTIGYETPARLSTRQALRVRDELIESARRKAALCAWLLRERPWDFFLTVFGETHRGGHLLWPHRLGHLRPSPPDSLLQVYRAVDAAVGEVLAAVPDDALVMIVSPNGMGENISQEHFMQPLMERINALFLKHEGLADGSVPPYRKGVTRWLRERVPDRLQSFAGRIAPIALRDEIVNRQYTAGHDWERTPAIAIRADLPGYVRLNLRGREARGMLEPGSAQLARYEEWLCRCLRSLRFPDSGAPVVREPYFTRDIYPGPRQELLPDVVVTFVDAPPAQRLCSDLLGDVHAAPNTGRPGNHRPQGFCLALRADAGAARPGAFSHIRDIAPFLLRHFLGTSAAVAR